VTDSSFGDVEIERIELGPDVEIVLANAQTEDQVVDAALTADGILVQWAPITRSVLDRLPRLRAIVRYGVGLDNVDLVAAQDRGVVVKNVADYCIDEVADHALSFIVANARRLIEFDRGIKDGAWNQTIAEASLPPPSDPVGIAGYGRIGQALSQRLRSLGFPVWIWDPFAAPTEPTTGIAVCEDLVDLARQVNHLSLHVPLTESTRHIVSGEVLEALGPRGHIVNTARGPLIDDRELLDRLDDGRLGWASLDVFSTEPPTGVSEELSRHRRVTATPHVAYLSTVSPMRLRQIAARSLRAAIAP
jgi:D-3-phosphoglycerate dehydrogenase